MLDRKLDEEGSNESAEAEEEVHRLHVGLDTPTPLQPQKQHVAARVKHTHAQPLGGDCHGSEHRSSRKWEREGARCAEQDRPDQKDVGVSQPINDDATHL